MRYAIFLGCTVPARARNYELSARTVANRFGIELVDIDGFACCGFPIRSLNKEATHLMAARDLALAQEKDLDILTLCSACTGVLTETAHELEEEGARNEVNTQLKKINKEYKGGVKVKHIARLLYEEIGLDKVRGEVSRELSELKVAPHYGCHYLKPSSIYEGFDNHEDPKSLHRLIEVTGATPVDYEDLKSCCGGGVLAVNEEVALDMAGLKLDHITSNGADCMTLICPFCSVMYDDNQKKIRETREKDYNLPVLYYTQLLGLAMGLDPKSELGFQINKVKTKDLLAKLGVEE